MPSLGNCATLVLEKRPDLASKVVSVYADICAERKPLANIVNNRSKADLYIATIIEIFKGRSLFFDITKHTRVKDLLISELQHLPNHDTDYSARMAIVYPWLFNIGEDFIGFCHDYMPTVFLGAEHFQAWLIDRMKNSQKTLEDSQLCFIIAAALYQTDKSLLASIPRNLIETFIRWVCVTVFLI